MLRHFLITSIRQIKKNKTLFLLKLIGLAIGLASSFFIFLYAKTETSYDKYHEKRDRIFKVLTENLTYQWTTNWTPFILASTLKNEFPEVVKATTISNWITYVQSGEDFIREKVAYADPELFEIFTLPIVQGDPENLLPFPNSVVISEKMVTKYFKDKNPIGKELTIQHPDKEISQLTVSAIMKDIPSTSTFKANLIGNIIHSIKDIEKRFNDPNAAQNWQWDFANTYILLLEGSSFTELEEKFPSFQNKYLGKDLKWKFSLQNISRTYLHSENVDNISTGGSLSTIYIFVSVGALILLIGCINYILLTTASSLTRIKEIGIRKVVGANRFILVKQVMGESLLFSILAFPVAVTLVHILLPSVNELFSGKLYFSYKSYGVYLQYFLIITLGVGFFSGIYLASYISSFSPLQILRSRSYHGIKKNYFRRCLIILQSVIFIVLIDFTGIIYFQIHYTQNRDLGFNKQDLIILNIPNNEFEKHYNSFLNAIRSNPNIINAAGAYYGPPEENKDLIRIPSVEDPSVQLLFAWMLIDYNYLETLEFKIEEGRSFAEQYSTDSLCILLNETAVKTLALAHPIGEIINGKKVIGVIKDFHLHSFHKKIPPMYIGLSPITWIETIYIRVNHDDFGSTLKFIETKWNEFAPDVTFQYKFFNNALDELYGEDTDFGKVISLFSFVAIFLASIGLLGLSLFLAEQRKQEIGIRKVFGASVATVIKFIAIEYIGLIAIANLIAFPVAWYTLYKYLQNFEYRTKIEIWLFVLSAALSILIVLITISFSTFKAAKTLPAKTLKYE